MTFSQPVVLEGLISQGATSNMGARQHYVSGFSIYVYSKSENGSLQLYPSVCCPVYRYLEQVRIARTLI